MLIQNVVGQAQLQGRLALRWTIHCADVKAISIEIATDREFTQQRKLFVLPIVTQCTLFVGAGMWFYRVGAWSGEVTHGTIEWSGIYGPATVATPFSPKPNPPFTLLFKQTQPIYGGIQYYTDKVQQYYAILEYSKTNLRASQRAYQYVLDDNKGFVAVSNLHDHLTYTIRISTFENNSSTLPTTEVIECTEGKVYTEQKSMKQQTLAVHEDRAQLAGGAAMLQQEKEGRPIRFNSYTEYTRYMGLKAMTTAGKKSL